MTSGLRSESCKELATGGREKRVSGTEAYGENKCSVFKNIRKSSTVRTVSGGTRAKSFCSLQDLEEGSVHSE